MATIYVYAVRLEDGRLDYHTNPNDHPPQNVAASWQVNGVETFADAVAAVLMQAADQWVGSGITVTRLIPREPTNEEKLENARRILRSDYWDDVRNYAGEIRKAIESGELTDADGVTERLEEMVDSAHRVIYTYVATETVIFFDNDGAYEDHFGSEGMVEDGVVQWSKLAYFAFLEDIRDTLGNIDELLAEHATECADCGVKFADDDEAEVYEGKRVHVSCPEEEEDDDGSAPPC